MLTIYSGRANGGFCDGVSRRNFLKIGALPVVEDGRLVGIVTESDFVRAMAGSSHAA